MNPVSSDTELIGAFVVEGSENAFRAIVKRHAGLVYATALRQVGDRCLAEEITQNVFVALARKASRLTGAQTIAGWLHRTAILESKAVIRSELRRRHREQKAVTLETQAPDPSSQSNLLLALADEALLQLGDSDRTALILRFCEDLSLREVGAALGVDEDAARKRVSRALHKVTDFFRDKGITVPAGSGIGVVLAKSATAVPPSLVSSVTQAGMAAGKFGGAQVALYHLLNLGTKKAVIGCAALACVPLLWQSQVQARLEKEQAELAARTESMAGQFREAQSTAAALEETLHQSEAALQKHRDRLAELTAQQTGKVKPAVYEWDDSSPYMRLPKQFLTVLPQSVHCENNLVRLDELSTEFLQMAPAESEQVRSAIQALYDNYQSVLMQKGRWVDPLPEDLAKRKPEEVRVFEVPDLSADVKYLRDNLFQELKAVLGEERFAHFLPTLSDWMPTDEKDRGFSSARGVMSHPHRHAFYKPEPGDPAIAARVSQPGRGSMSGPKQLDQIPAAFRSQLQDWIQLARSERTHFEEER